MKRILLLIRISQRTQQKLIVIIMQIQIRRINIHPAHRYFLVQQVAKTQPDINSGYMRQGVTLLIRHIYIFYMQGVEKRIIHLLHIQIDLQGLCHLGCQPTYGSCLHTAVTYQQREHIHHHQGAYDKYRYYVRESFHWENSEIGCQMSAIRNQL